VSSRKVVFLFLEKEWRDLRGNSRVWPVFLILPLIGIVLPVAFALATPAMLRDAEAHRDPAMQTVIAMLQRLPEFAGLQPAEAMARYLVRAVAGIFLLMPVVLSSTSAAFSIVGEKQQRTLEPILATPITDRQLLMGKLLASGAPTVLTTWAAGAAACILVDALTWGRFSGPLLPDRFWVVGLLVLAPLLGVAVILVTMLMSARSTDPQATVQATALAVIPAFLLGFGAFGKLLTVSFPALLAASGAVLVLDLALFRRNLVGFRREEILTRWK